MNTAYPVRTNRTIPAWSFSALKMFEECPYRAALARIYRIPELPRPAPADGGEHANDRGTRIHDASEAFVRGKIKNYPREMKEFHVELNRLKEMYNDGIVIMEDTWAFDQAWKQVNPEDFKNIWVRIKIDVFTLLSPYEAVVIDYKTGKRFGNEVKHAEQTQLYQLAALMRFPDLEEIHTEIWYPDVKELHRTTFSARVGKRYFRGFNERGLKMTSCKNFKPKPNAYTCKFCPYGKDSNKWLNKCGTCPYAAN